MTLVVAPMPSIEAAHREWVQLADRSGNLFATWEWAAAWWETYGGDRRLLLHDVRTHEGELVAILPLFVALDGLVRVIRLVGHGPADQLGPICGPERRADVATALRSVVAEQGPRTVLLAERLRGDEGWEQALAGRVVRQESTPVLEVAGRTWEEWLASRSANLRQQTRRLERKLTREHALELRLVVHPDEMPSAFDELVRLHDARWGGESSAFSPQRRSFHERFLRLATERGWARLWLALFGDRPVAAWLGFRFGGADWYYQAGRDPAWAGTSVGRVLLMRTLRAAFEDGVDEYRFLLGDEPFKSRLASRDPGLATIAVGARTLTGALQFATSAAGAMPLTVRSAVRRAANA